jgi:hypothetical protein
MVFRSGVHAESTDFMRVVGVPSRAAQAYVKRTACRSLGSKSARAIARACVGFSGDSATLEDYGVLVSTHAGEWCSCSRKEAVGRAVLSAGDNGTMAPDHQALFGSSKLIKVLSVTGSL